MDDALAPDEHVQLSDDEDIGHDHISTVNLRQSWWKPLTEDRPATPKPAWTIPSSDMPVPANNWASDLAQVIIQSDFFFNKDLEYLRYGHKSGCPALSISKMKATYYPDVGLEQMVPDQISLFIWVMFNEEDCHSSSDLKEYIIAKRGTSKYLYRVTLKICNLLSLLRSAEPLQPKDKQMSSIVFNLWTRNLVIRQRVEDFQLGIESYQTQLNLTKPRWDVTSFEYKHNFTVIDSPRAFTFRDKYRVQMIIQFNEIHKFSDGTLQQIDEALDYRVKEFKKQGVHVRHSETAQDKEDLLESGKLCWWKDKRRRL
ncbi:hypothetical protein Tco_0245989 [Tanacetum coccineum]